MMSLGIKMTKEKDLEKKLNNEDINVDRGLELILSHRREPLKEDQKILSSKLKFFGFEISFTIKKSSQEKKPCKKHLSQ